MPRVLTIEELEQRVRNSWVIDLRDKPFYYLGHIEGACWMPFSLLLKCSEEILDFDDEVILYDEGGFEGRAVDLAEVLERRGYEGVYVYQGGWNEWNQRHPTGLKDAFL